jgi:hypothetical protein
MRKVWLIVWLIVSLGALLFALGAGSASASWGLFNTCNENNSEHCYALAEDDIETYATVALQETRVASVPNCGSGFVTQEMWAFPKAEIGGQLDEHWIETGQIVGRGYCDQKPHIFTAEEVPDAREDLHFEESSAPTWEHQLNMYAISDLPEKNGLWHTYYRIPNESGVWSEFGSTYGGGWSTEMYEENAGMEVSDTEAPYYEGAEETAYTNYSIQWPLKNAYNWTGADSWAEYGNTCIQALTGSGAGPGNNAEAVCNGV